MKTKLCWIPFIPLTIAAAVFRVLHVTGVFEPPGKYYFSYVAVYLVIAMFAVNIVFVALDKKTSPVYLLTRNIPAAVFAMLSAAAIASKSALKFIVDMQNAEQDMLGLLSVVMGLVTAICMVFIGMSHFQGRNFLPRMGLLFLAMPLWAGMMLISEFLENRTISVLLIDPFVLFSFVFTMVFMFKLSMVIATIKGKNPVKSIFLYGFPLAGLGVAYGIGTVADIAKDGVHYAENVTALIFFSLALYVITFAVELTRLARTNEEQLVEFDLDNYEEEIRAYGNLEVEGNVIITPDEQTGDYDYDYGVTSSDAEAYITESDGEYTDDYDYDYGYGTELDAESLVVAPDVEDDDAIYVDSDIVEQFEEKPAEDHAEAKAVSDSPDKTVDLDDLDNEQMEKINRILEDIE